MESVIKGLVIYFFLVVVFRAAGKRTLAEITNFDLVLLLIISETTQQAMVGDDYSITNACLLILSLVGVDILLSGLKCRYPKIAALLDSVPLVLIEDGKIHDYRIQKSRVDLTDIMRSARLHHGIERLDQIKYAVLEEDGEISIVPYRT